MRPKTWCVLRWNDPPQVQRRLGLICPECSTDAEVPTGEAGALIIATIGITIVFDPPGHKPPANFLPDAIQCRNCRRIFAKDET